MPYSVAMRAVAIWLCLAFLWAIDAAFAWRRQDLRQTLVAAIFAFCFFAAGVYFAARGRSRPR